MKKLVMTVAVLACAASIVSAQVTSVNIVGYNKAGTANGLVILSQQFEGGSTPTELFGSSLPLGSTIYQYNGAGYNVATYQNIFLVGDAWSTELDLSVGGFWVQSSAVNTNIFSGDVPAADSITNNLAPGLTMTTYPYPVAVSISDLDLTPSLGDTIYQYNGAGYNVSTYQNIFLVGDAWSADLSFAVGEGFWYSNNDVSTNIWIEAKPF